MARYLPAEDTRLLKDSLRPFNGRACLEIGFGSGAVVSSLSRKFALAVGTDVIGLDEARLARSPGVDIVLADKAGCFREGSFDLVFFNPPYLPSEKVEDAAVDGGPTGVEVPIAFLEDAARVSRRAGVILALLSEAGDVERFLGRARALGFRVRTVAKKGVFYENLVVFRMEKSSGKAKTHRPAAKTVVRR